MVDGSAALRAMAGRVAALGSSMSQVSAAVADAARGDIERSISAGESNDGKPWQLRQDGGKPLATVAKDLRVVSSDKLVIIALLGHVARHHLGTAKGRIQRAIIPTDGLSGSMELAIVDAALSTMRDIASGRRG